MSAERIRQAAKVLREAASKATDVTGASDWFSTMGGRVRSSGGPVCDSAFNEAEYIALMAPPVALALADWLDAEARECDPMVTRRHERDGVPVRDAEREVLAGHPALALADAILGGKS